jgi:cytochrome P450
VGIVEDIQDAVAGIRHGAEHAAEAATDVLGRYIDRHALGAFEHLREHHPIVSTRPLAVVTLADDVREVLGDFESFTVALYAPKMEAITGPFILGLDDTPLYRRDHAALRAAVRADDLPHVERIVGDTARERVAAAAGGTIDVVTELVEPAVTRAIGDYFGTPGPDPATLVRWATNLFEDIFVNVGNLTSVHDRALDDAAQMRPYVDGVVGDRKAAIERGDDVPDDVLTRLLRQEPPGALEDVSIRHNLIGLIAGWIPTVSKAFTLAVEELLHRPAELRSAQQAARAGDRDTVAAYVWEAMRFRPQNWSLLRKCAADRTIAAGTDREATIEAGAVVVAATLSAMHDERAVEAPDKFRPGRPWSDYMHFGHGLHECFGEQINRVQLPALAMALFERGELSRAPGDAGEVKWRGDFPSGLRVAIGA